ncbi:MAG: protein-disulfide reductase DsbD N-terminal domain-containing protein [Candidatus Saccharicenans sp.]|nr:protein-disulfide reductase DsbD N-terminal domain-containing protein [Candidatus Saccharicenans sp.]
MKERNARLLAIFLMAMAILLTAYRTAALAQEKNVRQSILTVKPIPPAKPVAPGDAFEITLELTVAPGFHINSQKPEDELLVPTSVELKKDPALELKEVIFPEAKKKKFKFSDKPLSVYEGQVKVNLKIELAEDVCGSSLEIEGKVRYQACDQEACLRPASVPFKTTIKLAS